MKRIFLLLFSLTNLLLGEAREKALALATEAGQLVATDPTRASELAEEAYQVLKDSTDPAQPDLSACAGLTARTARLDGDYQRARQWFQTALSHAASSDAATLRAELSDMLMREGDLALARQTLGTPPKLSLPSHALAQWHQTSAKLHLACGLPKQAKTAIQAAIDALPPDDHANHVSLAIDAVGIDLRLGLNVTPLIEETRQKLRKLPDPHPEHISSLTSIAAQNPELSSEEALALLQSVDLDTLPKEARLTYSISVAEAAARAHKPEIVSETLKDVLKSDLLPDDHPLLSRALALAADASGDSSLAIQSAQVAIRWLSVSDDSEVLLGLQRTVDPLSPLIHHAAEALPEAALTAQNFALRNRLGGTVTKPTRQTVLYLIYQKDFEQHYGALVFAPEPQWIPLGAAERIHTRITDTIATAERTLGEVEVGVRITVRLTQLWKSLWEPLSESIDPTKPIDIVPVGMLHAVPWATLRQRDGKYLCQILAEARLLALTGEFPKQQTQDKLLAIGTSSAPGALPNQGEFPFDDQLANLVGKLPPLLGVKKELAVFDRPTHENLTRKDFLKTIQNQGGTLHLAGHGFVIESEEGHGFRAGLIFHGGGPQNILFARDIATLDLSNTNLVVLSACRGGIGQSEVGGNWSSLRRSFIAAGARQVMAAQWQVRDDQIPAMMKQFYQNRETQPNHQALWNLQKQWVQKGTDLDVASAGAWVLECVPQDE